MSLAKHTGETPSDVPDAGELKVKFEPIAKTLVSPFTELFPGCTGQGLVRGKPGGFVFSYEYGRNAQKIYEFKPRKDDVWLMSFPRSGKRLAIHTTSSSFALNTGFPQVPLGHKK